MSEQPIFKIEDGHVKIKGLYIGLPTEKATQILSGLGFGHYHRGMIEGLGICRLTIRGSRNVDNIVIATESRFTEHQTLAVMKQVSADLSADPGFDYNGYGIAPKPHEIDHFWDIKEGLVTIRWDGFNVQGYSSKNNDGLDHIVFSISRPVVKDEEYWRSEVD